ncbi:MAG TPA: glycosyltransferase family 2 protein [Candidatus Saccharimonadales bacterium]|nr:glycosyltransferase family 2 protein [Candidatus Saccharimonadales bacterium]
MKNNKPLTLSIVIPAYNEERYLKACLDSIALQTVKPDEVIVIDNNSVDDTIQIARTYKNVKILQEKQQGVFFASKKGFSAAKCDIIARIDADTILPPNWVELVINDFQDTTVAATTGPVTYYDMPMPMHNYWFDHLMRKLTYNFSPDTPFLYGSNMAVRRQQWRKLSKKLCSERDIHEDIDLAIHFYQNNLKIKYNKRLLSGASGRRYNDSTHDFKEYIAMYKRSYKNHNLHGKAVLPALFMWSLGYILVHPWRNLWYALHKYFYLYPSTREARKNPMSG